MREVRNILSVSCGYVAAVVGAGFASGQEIVSFFLRYGKMSIVGIVIAAVIFSAFSYIVMSRCMDRKITSYDELTNVLFKHELTRKIVRYASALLALCTLCVMTACAAELAGALFGVGGIYGAAVFSLLCGAILFLKAKKILQFNSALGALMIFGVMFTCLYIFRYREHQTFVNGGIIMLSGASYAGYNLLTVGSLLSGMSAYLKNKREALLSSVVSGGVLLIMIMMIWGVLGIYYGKINLGEIPMLTMAMRQSNWLGAAYSVMLVMAVVTTGVSSGFAVSDIMSGKWGSRSVSAAAVVIAFCMSGGGFARLVGVLYGACGYVGILIVAAVIFSGLRCEKGSKIEKIEVNASKHTKKRT